MHKKTIKIVEYCNKKLLPNDLLFLQETHSTLKVEVWWRD